MQYSRLLRASNRAERADSEVLADLDEGRVEKRIEVFEGPARAHAHLRTFARAQQGQTQEHHCGIPLSLFIRAFGEHNRTRPVTRNGTDKMAWDLYALMGVVRVDWSPPCTA